MGDSFHFCGRVRKAEAGVVLGATRDAVLTIRALGGGTVPAPIRCQVDKAGYFSVYLRRGFRYRVRIEAPFAVPVETAFVEPDGDVLTIGDVLGTARR